VLVVATPSWPRPRAVGQFVATHTDLAIQLTCTRPRVMCCVAGPGASRRRPFLRIMEDAEHFYRGVPEPVHDEIGQSGNNQLAGAGDPSESS
jgi:hypothetical protein